MLIFLQDSDYVVLGYCSTPWSFLRRLHNINIHDTVTTILVLNFWRTVSSGGGHCRHYLLVHVFKRKRLKYILKAGLNGVSRVIIHSPHTTARGFGKWHCTTLYNWYNFCWPMQLIVLLALVALHLSFI